MGVKNDDKVFFTCKRKYFLRANVLLKLLMIIHLCTYDIISQTYAYIKIYGDFLSNELKQVGQIRCKETKTNMSRPFFFKVNNAYHSSIT